jgi:Fe2+ or Zn2+ uptake regulation protein
MTLAHRIAENRRLCILKTLEELPDYRANESLLHQMVEEFAFSASRDQVRGDLSWLAEQCLVELSEIAGVMIARITARGVDVATGRAAVPGVKRPEPR